MIAVMMYQALRHFGKDVFAFDTDPVNATLASFREFENVTLVDVMQDGNIDPREFDSLLESLIAIPADANAIVDNGASSFIALGSYLEQNDVLHLLEEHGHRVFFHSVITGVQALGDTLNGLARLCMSFPQSPIIVGLNPFFCEISADGKTFDQFTIYQENSGQFHALMPLPKGNNALIGKDLEELFAQRQSFDSAINGSTTHIAVKSRLRRYWNKILSCIEQAQIL